MPGIHATAYNDCSPQRRIDWSNAAARSMIRAGMSPERADHYAEHMLTPDGRDSPLAYARTCLLIEAGVSLVNIPAPVLAVLQDGPVTLEALREAASG